MSASRYVIIKVFQTGLSPVVHKLAFFEWSLPTFVSVCSINLIIPLKKNIITVSSFLSRDVLKVMMLLGECDENVVKMSNVFPSDYLRGYRSNRRRPERGDGHPDLHVCVRSQRQHRGDAAAEERGQVASETIKDKETV